MRPSDYQAAVDAEIVARSRPGVWIYAVAALTVVLVTPVRRDYPLIAWGLLAASVFGGLLRALTIRRYRTCYARHPSAWRRVFVGTTLVVSLCWGVVGGLLAHLYGPSHTLLLFMLAGAGFSAKPASRAGRAQVRQNAADMDELSL